MDSYHSFKNDLLAVNKDLVSLLSTGKSISGIPERSFDNWEATCNTLYDQLSEEVLRIAVVGSIKSGKSTFLNALFKDDYLKRGAGVVTSIVTRVRGGRKPTAKLLFKTVDEINEEIAEAIALLPADSGFSNGDAFNIREDRHRAELNNLIEALPTEHLITRGTRNLNTVLLRCYLNGFDSMQDLLFSGSLEKEFKKKEFQKHWDFVGNDAHAIYLKDIVLEVGGKDLARDTEFADCQGSDSANPLHLALIQEYIQLSHLIIYLISSRTGLREADIKFLSIIKKMGILDNVMFVVNCDMSEHETLEDLQSVSGNVAEDLHLFKSDPKVYVFSALLDLFKSIESKLPEKDVLRLAQWNSQKEIASFCDNESLRFQTDLSQRLNQKRAKLLLKNQVERHGVVLSGMSNWININRELFSRDEKEAEKIIQGITQQQKKMVQIKKVVEATGAGAVPKIKDELKNDSNRFFDADSGESIGNLIDFIRNYSADSKYYKQNSKESGFMTSVSLVFQEFKRALDRKMADSVYPDVVSFVFKSEKKVEAYFKSIFEPYESLVDGALADLEKVLNEFDIKNNIARGEQRPELPTLDELKETSKLKLPPLVAIMRYSAKIKTEAIVRLGYYAVVKGVTNIFKKGNPVDDGTYFKALQSSVEQMKQLTEKTVLYQCKDYRENLKFKYLFKLVDLVAQKLTETLTGRFQAYGIGTAEMVDLIKRHQADKTQAIDVIRQMESLATGVGARIADLRKQVDQMRS